MCDFLPSPESKNLRELPQSGVFIIAAQGYIGVKIRAVKYRDKSGNTWAGRGAQPVWLRDKLKAGAKLEDFAVNKRRASRKKTKKRRLKARRNKANHGKRPRAGR